MNSRLNFEALSFFLATLVLRANAAFQMHGVSPAPLGPCSARINQKTFIKTCGSHICSVVSVSASCSAESPISNHNGKGGMSYFSDLPGADKGPAASFAKFCKAVDQRAIQVRKLFTERNSNKLATLNRPCWSSQRDEFGSGNASKPQTHTCFIEDFNKLA